MRRERLLVTLCLSALLLAACGGEAPKTEPLRPVLTMRVGEAGSSNDYIYAGEVRSRIEQTLAFRVPGKISERLVDAGASVRPGQVLARIDPADASLSAGASEAQRQLAEADAARFRELKAKNFVSQAALDSRETQLKAAAAQAALSGNQTNYTTLKADQPGVVGQMLAEVGQVVAAGQPVIRLARADTLEVAIAIPENRLADVRRANEAEVSLWADATTRYRGRLREVAAMPDPQTRTYAARVSIDDPGTAVVFGMSASVRFKGGGSAGAGKVVAIPQTALFQKNGKPAVWLVGAEDRLELREVVVARYGDERVELSSGLAPGERIAVAGIHKLTVGERIRVAELGANGRLAPVTTR